MIFVFAILPDYLFIATFVEYKFISVFIQIEIAHLLSNIPETTLNDKNVIGKIIC